MNKSIFFNINQTTIQGGCFTFESYLKGQRLSEIARRLGLPKSRLEEGAYIARANYIPTPDHFDLGGITLDSTDNFVDYRTEKIYIWLPNGSQWKKVSVGERKSSTYQESKFKALYKGINIEKIKLAYHSCFTLDGPNSLVKVILKIPHTGSTKYPAGTFLPQFLMRNLGCHIVADLNSPSAIWH